MSPPATVNTMPRHSQMYGAVAAQQAPASDVVSLRNFVVDEDAANFGSALLKTIDKSSFIMAQQEALESFNMAKALRLSEETAAREHQHRRRRNSVAAPTPAISSSRVPASDAASSSSNSNAVASSSTTSASMPTSTSVATAAAPQAESTHTSASSKSQPLSIGDTSDEAAARSLARSWQVDALQPALLENRGALPASPPRPKLTHTGSSSASTSTYPHQQAHHVYNDKRASTKVSQNVSLSTTSSSVASQPTHSHSNSSSSSAQQSQSHSSHSRTHSHSQSHSRTSSQTQVQPQRAEPRPVLRRDPATIDGLSTSPPRPQATRATTSASDMISPKRTRKASVSTSQYPYSSSHSSSSYNTSNTAPQAQSQVVAPVPTAESKKTSSSSSSPRSSSRDIQAGQIMSPSSASSGAITPPQVQSSSASTQAAQAQAPTGERRARRRSSAVQMPQVAPAQSQAQVSASTHQRDIFAPTRFKCTQCGGMVASGVKSQSSLNASADPFAHPSTALLHLSCTSCGTAYCRGCLKGVKCRDTYPASSMIVSTITITSPSTVTSASSSASAAAAKIGSPCHGGAGCALWSCCSAVRAIAVWEALRAFDWVFSIEAGFTPAGMDQQVTILGREPREAYVKLLISKADKSMRRFEDAFVRTLRVVCSWLQPPSSSAPSDEPVDYEQIEKDRLAHEGLLTHLFSNSYLLEVVHAFLSNNNVRDWISHSETYLVILELLRKMGDSGLGGVLSTPFGSDAGTKSSAPNTSTTSTVYNAFAPPATASLPPMSLCDLVKQLEAHRRPLMALAGKVQFSATVEKVNNLCDAISYLLLQQVVGGF